MNTYMTLQEVLDAPISKFTVVRNNSTNDDGWDTISNIPPGYIIDGNELTSLRVHGDANIGFNSNTKHFRANDVDGRSLYVYYEIGSIGVSEFIRVRWNGHTRYSNMTTQHALDFDFFIFKSGLIFVNLYTAPTDRITGSKGLYLSTESIPYVYESEPLMFYYESMNPSDGTDWVLTYGKPDIVYAFQDEGTALFELDFEGRMLYDSKATWDEYSPIGTTVDISASFDNENWVPMTNGSPVLNRQNNVDSIFIKIHMTTDDESVTPTISNLIVNLYSDEEVKKIVLVMKPLEKFNNAAGPITVVYSGGYLMGEGGPVEPFEETFTPTDLIMKPNQMVRERLELSSLDINAQLTPIIYTDVSSGREQLELSSLSITADLIPIDDI